MQKNKNKTYIIAEAGVNHNGSLKKALDLINMAKKAGADCIKFQVFDSSKLSTKQNKLAPYQKNNTEFKTQIEMLKKYQLNKSQYLKLYSHSKIKKIDFLCSPFDIESIDLLCSMGIKSFKIPSGEITNYPYLKNITTKNKPIILSTGMANLSEITRAVEIFTANGISKDIITVLHCNTEYPTPMKDVNLKAMLQIKNSLGVKVGYSDHTEGIEIPIAAVALGASVIEKHFTIDRELPGPDHRASLEPNELKSMIKSIRNIEKAISGNGKKEPSDSEMKNIDIVRKSIHILKDVKKGQKISEDLLIPLRPGNGISPMEIPKIIGKYFVKDLKSYSKLKYSDLDE